MSGKLIFYTRVQKTRQEARNYQKMS